MKQERIIDRRTGHIFNADRAPWPGRKQPVLRVILFLLFFTALCLGILSGVKYESVLAAAPRVPVGEHSFQVTEHSRIYYVSEAEWRNIQILDAWAGIFVSAALLIMFSSLGVTFYTFVRGRLRERRQKRPGRI